LNGLDMRHHAAVLRIEDVAANRRHRWLLGANGAGHGYRQR
jgi:hypothetical protein